MPKRSPAAIDLRSKIGLSLHDQLARFERRLRVLRSGGMSAERLGTLSAIDKGGPISVTTLADKEMVRPASMSRMIAALVDEGLVERNGDQNDGRAVLVSVTAMGRRICRHARKGRLTHFVEALESMSDEQLGTLHDLAKALERLTPGRER